MAKFKVRDALRRADVLAEIARRLTKRLSAVRSSKRDDAAIAKLRAQLENVIEAVTNGGMRSSPALGRKLADLEAELARLESVPATRKVARLPVGLRAGIGRVINGIEAELGRDVERGRAELRQAIPGSIKLRPEPKGRFLQAEIGLEVRPPGLDGGESETLVAGVGFEPTTFGL